MERTRKYRIATGKNRFDRLWINVHVDWSWLMGKLSEPAVTHETASEYRVMSRERQTQLKDVGGFVGGYLRNGVRKAGSIEARSVVTLDYDDFSAERLEELRGALKGSLWALHSTHKHTDSAWRVRVVIALARDVTPDEYGAVARRLAQRIGFAGIDRSTFEPSRLMFWPSRSKDAPWLFEQGDGEPVNPDGVLASYDDWTDMTTWPLLPEEEEAGILVRNDEEIPTAVATALHAARNGKSQQDPLEKKGLIGAFCRTYGVDDAITSFLPDVYNRTGNRRYTHVGSSTSNGAWVIDGGRYLYSFHSTDPAMGKLLNSWDLVRLHKFGDLDRGKESQADRLPSFKEMEKLALNDPAVRRRLMDERMDKAVSEFDGMDLTEQEEEDVRSWDELRGEMLKTDKNGEVKATAANLEFILDNHPLLKGRWRLNTFSGKIDVTGKLPWMRENPTWNDRDSVKLRSFLDRRFGITGEKKIEDALTSVAIDHGYHPVREYLDTLEWDGVPRLGKLFTDVLGAEKLPVYTRLAELIFTAAVRRVRKPGCKFDYFPVLYGQEGCFKSTLFRVMGGEWFTDSVDTIEGKEGRENIQGKWIIEMAELSGTKKSDRERLKNFISSQVDDYRAAYARMTESRPRQCILVGTTNEEYFLRGMTDRNRRQPVVEIDPKLRTIAENPSDWITANRDQLWAEACLLEAKGEPLYLGEEWEKAIREVQDRHNMEKSNILFPEVLEFLDYYLPEGWETWGLAQRRQWLNGQNEPTEPSIIERRERRRTVTVAEILQEFFGMDRTDREYNARGREIGQLMASLKDDWKPVGVRKSKLYGKQKTWQRTATEAATESGCSVVTTLETRQLATEPDFFGCRFGCQSDEDLSNL